MTTAHNDFRLTMRHLLIPVSLLSLAVFLLLAFQSMQVLRDRGSLNAAKVQQEQAFQDSQKLQAQLSALLTGTQKLADQGNKGAKEIMEKLKVMGIQMSPPPAQTGMAPAPVPAAAEAPGTGPVKP